MAEMLIFDIVLFCVLMIMISIVVGVLLRWYY